MKAEHAIIRILANPEKRIPEGGGVLVDSDHILTCVHVVDAVSVDDQVWFDFSHFPDSPACKGEVVRRDEAADIAVVKILPDQELPSAAVPARFMTPAEDGFEKQAYICGFPENLEKGDWAYGRLVGETGAGWIQMDHDLTSKLVKPGFSGSPAWVDNKSRSAGLVVQRFTGEGESSAYVVPVRTLLMVFPELSVVSADVAADRPASSPPQAEGEPKPTTTKKMETLSMDCSVLHLSDLHFGNTDQAELWADQLIHDLTGELDCGKLDAVVVSGDVANRADPAEFEAARQFMERVVKEFGLKHFQLAVVPGNHDLNRPASEEAYQLQYRSKYKGELKEGCYYEEGPKIICVRDEDEYKTRFQNFGVFFKAVKNQPFPLDYNRQGLVHIFPAARLVIAGFNSAWEIDHHFKGRASINPHAVSHVLNVLRERKETRGFLKMAVWHHPIQSAFDDRITDTGFLDRLVQAGFTVGLHGHLHKSVSVPYVYEHGLDGRKMHIIGAGTFGAPTKDWTPGVPLQYHLLTARDSKLSVTTRRRPEPDGAWEPDPVWRQGPGRDPASRLVLSLPEISSPVSPDPDEKHCEKHCDSIGLEIPYLYKEWINDHCADMDFTKLIGTSKAIHASLPKVFIPLTGSPPIGIKESLKTKSEIMGRENQERDIEELIAENNLLVIEGTAGSGKTTLLKHFSFMTLNKPDDWKGLSQVLPVLVFLRRIKEMKWNGLGENLQSAETILSHYFDKVDCGLDFATVSAFCTAGRCAILLDGLDEILPNHRKTLLDAFSAFKRHFKNSKIVYSGRPHGIDDVIRPRLGKWILTINELSLSQREDFIHRWFIHIFQRETRQVTKTAEDMIGEIRSHPGIERLVSNPLMLTAVCLLYLDDKELPGQRAELYDRVIDNLLHRRFDDPESIRQFLMALAKRMHLQKIKGIDRVHALEELKIAMPGASNESVQECRIRLESEFDYIEPTCGLLKPGDGEYEFQHLTFQEFLAAAAIASEIREKSEIEVLQPFWKDPHFGEMVELYIGYRSIHSKGTANYLVSEVLKAKDLPPFDQWRLAARALLDIHPRRREPDVETLARNQMLSVIGSEAKAMPRADAGEILGRLGDPRDLKAFVRVPDGKYRLSMGEVEIEKPFEIGKYPVTNGWYREFIDAGGYQNSQWWTPEGRKWIAHTQAQIPEFWHQRKWNNPSAPVVGVCWWEAAAFLNWLTKTRDDGYRYFLPSEIQWEAVAAGKEGKGKYPWRGDWADDHCNSEEAGLKQTSVVGVFPKGDTPGGVVDLSGNVWEWTESDYHSKDVLNDFPFEKEIQKLYEQILQSKGDERKQLLDKYLKLLDEKDRKLPVLRGGSWNNDRDRAARSYRDRDNPNERNSLVGFRAARTKS